MLTVGAWLGCCVGLLAQTNYTLSGNLTDAETGEDLLFAEVSVNDGSGAGTTSNAYGFYSLTLPAGTYEISFAYLGFETLTQTVDLTQDRTLNVELATASETLAEIVVTDRAENANVTAAEGSVDRVDMRTLRELPALGGEPDIIKAVQLNPGVKPAGDGNGGFYVRGGGLDQNLILLDEAPVYNPSHLLGFFSVFNGDAIRNVTLYKGGMAAEYGGRTASVMDIRMRDGNKKEWDVTGGVGLIASRLTVEAPIVKDKGSFMVSGRRTYADLLLGVVSNDEGADETQLYFYDLNAKANYQITEKDRIFVSGYTGRDRFGFEDAFGLDWGNVTGTVRWNHVFNGKFFSNTTFIYSDYDYQFEFGTGEDRVGLQSVIRDLNFKQDFSYFANDRNSLKFGVNLIDHTIEPGNLIAGANTGITAEDAEPTFGYEGAAYIQNEQRVGEKLRLNYGLRVSAFQRYGPGTAYTFDENGETVGSEIFDEGDAMETYVGLEPRLAATYVLADDRSVKLGYNRNYQYLHLLTNATASTPTDTWIMSSENVKPQIADQVSLGYFQNFAQNQYEFGAEVYYKDMQNVIDYRNGANVFFNDQLEGELVFGDGRAYGLELFLRKTTGRLTGQIGYTLSRTEHLFDEINDGSWFPARQDRTHDINLLASYKLSDKFTLTGSFLYYTGDAVTFPSGRYEVAGTVVPLYTERNGYRMPDYHRLDLALAWDGKKTEKFESSWNVSLFNVYGRENAFSINFQPSEADPNVTEAVRLALFKTVPSVTYNFKF